METEAFDVGRHQPSPSPSSSSSSFCAVIVHEALHAFNVFRVYYSSRAKNAHRHTGTHVQPESSQGGGFVAEPRKDKPRNDSISPSCRCLLLLGFISQRSNERRAVVAVVVVVVIVVAAAVSQSTSDDAQTSTYWWTRWNHCTRLYTKSTPDKGHADVMNNVEHKAARTGRG